MLRTYGEEWNGFQFRSPAYLDGHFEPYEFDLVKWETCESTEVTDFKTGKKKIQTRLNTTKLLGNISTKNFLKT